MTPASAHRRWPTACGVATAVRWLAFVVCGVLISAPCAAADWLAERQFDSVVFRADFPLGPYEPLLGEVVEVNRELQRLLAIPAAREGIEVLLFHDDRAYSHYLRSHMAKAPDRRAIYLKQRGPGQVLVFRSHQMAVDLRHECTHAFLHAALPLVPLWLDEGLAEYFEVPGSQRADGNPHWNLLFQTQVRLGRVPRLADLEVRSGLDDLSAGDYQDAWSWVHFLLHGPAAGRDELARYLAEIAAGSNPGQLGPRLEQRLAHLDQAYLQHFRGWQRR